MAKPLSPEMQRIHDERLKILNRLNDLFINNCDTCTKLVEGSKKGIIPKGVGKDRKNVICDACPAHHQIRDIGEELTQLLTIERVLREDS